MAVAAAPCRKLLVDSDVVLLTMEEGGEQRRSFKV